MRQTWGEDRVFFLDGDGTQHSLPTAWTNARAPDVFVTIAAGRSPFRAEDLIALADLMDRLQRAKDQAPECKADSAVDVKRILP